MKELVPVPGFEQYKMNRLGQFFSKRGNNRILAICKRDNWYATVKLNERHRNIHRLMALAFIENPENHPMVNHKDGDKHNYSLDNLEWCTNDFNMKHAQRTGLLIKGTQVHTNILDEVQVLTIIQCLKDGMRCIDLARYFKVDDSTIGKIKTGKNWKHLLPMQGVLA